MPTGNCRYPEHHSPSAGPPLALLGAIIIGFTHAVVVAILAALAGAVFLLIHNHGSGYDPQIERRAEAEHAAHQIAGKYVQLDAFQAAQQLAAQQRAAIEAPVIRNHLHLHGIGQDDMAGVVRKALQPPDHL